MTYHVCILAAGSGSRMGAHSETANKALLPVRDEAVISRIMSSFVRALGPGTEFVVALGCKGPQVRDFLGLAHPQLTIRYVDVDPWQGPGSGPGRSLLACADALPESFYFVCGDTLWSEDLDAAVESDWMGVAAVAEDQSAAYCNAEIRSRRAGSPQVVGLKDKQRVSGQSHRAFIGLAHVSRASRDRFFGALGEASRGSAAEQQLAPGFEPLIRAGTLEAREFPGWIDVGTSDKYRRACRVDGAFDLGKEREYRYRSGDRMIKLFADPEVASNRVRRHAFLGSLVPPLLGHAPGMYAYRYAEGGTFYERGSPAAFRRLLSWLQDRLWRPRTERMDGFEQACLAFYREKTLHRAALFSRRNPEAAIRQRVNGVEVPPLGRLLDQLPWERLVRGAPSSFHGDLQFDNIIVGPRNDFVLIDWRQDFAGLVEYGDLYYDLAKLRAGIDLDLGQVRQKRFDVVAEGGSVRLSYPEIGSAPAYRKALQDHVGKIGLDPGHVNLLVGLIYINMAPLHFAPFDELLWNLGRLRLHQELARDRLGPSVRSGQAQG